MITDDDNTSDGNKCSNNKDKYYCLNDYKYQNGNPSKINKNTILPNYYQLVLLMI